MNRRDFLKRGGAFMLAGLATPGIFSRMAQAAETKRDRWLVIVQLAGGNDGLNMLVPFAFPEYYRLRPNIAIPKSDLYRVHDKLGLHRSISRIYPLFEQGNLAIVQGVGYERPTRSHFISTDIWQSARLDTPPQHGWLGRYGELALKAHDFPLKAMAYGTLLPMALLSQEVPCGCIDYLEQPQLKSGRLDRLKALYRTTGAKHTERVRNVVQAALEAQDTMAAVRRSIKSPVQYPRTPFAQFLRMAAEMMERGTAPRIFHAGIGGFDTHAGQRKMHDWLLQVVGDGLAAFQQDLTLRGLDPHVVTMTYSEFGRRTAENGSYGTDHGATAPHLLMGTPVRGGIYGELPDFGSLERGDLPYQIDFRRLYATVLEQWWGTPSGSILGGTFEPLGLL